MKLVNQIIKPLSGTPLQAYLDNRIQLFDIIEKILSETGPAEIYIFYLFHFRRISSENFFRLRRRDC